MTRWLRDLGLGLLIALYFVTIYPIACLLAALADLGRKES